MTPTELKDLIAATIAGQGTNVDAGGSLPKILNGIIDLLGGGAKPLIVEGTGLDGGEAVEFEPSAGQPSKQDAIDAFRSGRIVILKYDAQIEGPHETIITDLTYQNRLQSMYIEEGGASLKTLVW